MSAAPASPTRVLAAVLCICLGVGLIFAFQPPLLALVLVRNGASNLAVGAVTSVSLVAVLLFGPLYPCWITRLGLKWSVILGITVAAMILALMPVLPGVGPWLILRFLSGCVLGLSWIGSEIWLNTAASAQTRGTVMGIYGTVFSIGTMAGPALLEVTGTQGWQPFAVGAACILCTMLPLLLLRRIDGAPQTFTPMRGAASMLRRAPVVMLAAFVGGLIESADLTLLPPFGLQAGFTERTALSLIAVFMAGNVVLQVPIGLLADRYGRRRLLGLCAVLSTVGPLLLQSSLGSPGLLWPLLFLWGGTLYAFYSQGIALLGAQFPAADLATANTVFVMMYCLGGVVGPLIGGVAMDASPHLGLQLLVSGAACLLVAATGWSALRPAPHP